MRYCLSARYFPLKFLNIFQKTILPKISEDLHAHISGTDLGNKSLGKSIEFA